MTSTPLLRAHQLRAPKNFVFSLIAVIAAFHVWSTISSSNIVTATVSLPVAFYGNNDTNKQYVADREQYAIRLRGPRADLKKIATQGALHIDLATCSADRQTIVVNDEHLLLPNWVKLVHCDQVNVHTQANEPTPLHDSKNA